MTLADDRAPRLAAQPPATRDSAGDTSFSLNDRYTRESGTIFLTGIQALVRLPMIQRERCLLYTSPSPRD